MIKLNVFILDDEEFGIKNLERLLRLHCNEDIEIVGATTSVIAARKMIDQLQPDLLFIDIQMREIDGFGFLEMFSDISFAFIFVTAYESYALKALKFGAIDYILKPISIDELRTAIAKVKSKVQPAISTKHVGNKLVIYNQQEYSIANLNSLVYIKGIDNYSVLFLENETPITTPRTIKEYDIALQKVGFIRIHKSYIINLDFLKTYKTDNGGSVTLHTGTILPISRRKMKMFKTMLEKYTLSKG